MNNKLSYCGQVVKAQDRDRFLLSLFAPAAVREDLWALFAFNHEIAKTREVVSEMQLGLIRLQWWREAIGKIYEGGAVPEHEVLKALAAAIQKHDLPRENFETLIYAREFDLENVLPSTIEGTLHYADFTSTPLMKLAVQVMGDDPEAEPVQPVAVNYALAGILRAVPFHAAQGRCYLPEDLMKQHDIRLSMMFDLKSPEKLSEIVQAVVEQIVPEIAPQNILLQAAQNLACLHARRIKRLQCDVFSPQLQISPVFREFWLILTTRFC